MNAYEKVSIIVPVYNVKKYLDKCIKSLTLQSYNNIEIILVDDGSTDGSGARCDYWEQQDDRIKVIHQTNQGLSAARNAGLEIFTGLYVTFIDSDDFVSNDYIKILLKMMNDCNADVAISNIKYVYEDGQTSERKGNIYNTIKTGKEVILEESQGISYGISCGKLYKKDIFQSLRFPVGKCYEDEFVFHEVMWMVSKAVCTEKALYFYLQRADSIMGSGITSKKMLDMVEARRRRKEFFEAQKERIYIRIGLELYMNTIFTALDKYGGSFEQDMLDEMLHEYKLCVWKLCMVNKFRKVRGYLKKYIYLKDIYSLSVKNDTI